MEEQGEKISGSLGGTALFSPEGIVMITVAFIFDFILFILILLKFVGVGIPIAWVVNIIAGLFIGAWAFSRGGGTGAIKAGFKRKGSTKKEGAETDKKTSAAQDIAKKAGKKVLKKFAISFLGGLIPFVASIVPFWIIFVYTELKND